MTPHLHKVSCQLGHFISRTFSPTPSTSPPSPPSSTTPSSGHLEGLSGVHFDEGGKEMVTEDTTRVLFLVPTKWTFLLCVVCVGRCILVWLFQILNFVNFKFVGLKIYILFIYLVIWCLWKQSKLNNLIPFFISRNSSIYSCLSAINKYSQILIICIL